MNTVMQRMRPAGRASALGFTLVELMITLTVAALLFAIAIPNIRDALRTGLLASTGNDVIHSLQLARTEAIRRQRAVVFCASLTPQAAAPTCSAPGAGVSWGQAGWIVFQDNNNNQQFGAGDVIIERHDLIAQGVTIKSDGTGAESYSALGFAVAPTPGFLPTRNMVICDTRGNQQQGVNSVARALFISQSGRGRVSPLAADVTAALGVIPAVCP